jgi:hypothetical protein
VARFPFANKKAVAEFAMLADQLERRRLALWEKALAARDPMEIDRMDQERQVNAWLVIETKAI